MSKLTQKTAAVKVRICEKHTGKMEGFASLSTSPISNPICAKRSQNPGSICAHCYSVAMANRYANLDKKNAVNGELLSGSILADSDFPTINTATRYYKYFRLEAFGDLINRTHAKNYFRFCELNPETRFTLWTKNPIFIAQAIRDGYRKPENLTIIYSSPCLNHKVSFEKISGVFPFIDKVFTVWDEKTANAEKIAINCGARKCAGCLRCYAPNDCREIAELLK